MLRSTTFAVLALAVSAAAGCSGGPSDPPVEPDGQMELGGSDSGGDLFVELEDGTSVELVPGAQGGFHIWTGLRVRDLTGQVYLTREARLVSDGTLILKAQQLYLEVPELAMETWWEKEAAAPSFMCPSPVGIKIFDTEIALTAQILDKEGNILAEDHIVVIPRCPDGDHNEWCQRICSG